jgi:hypothetical protein
MLSEAAKDQMRRAIADPLVRLNNETIANQLQPCGGEQRVAEEFKLLCKF